MRSDTVGGTAAASVIYFAGYQDDGVAFCGEALDQIYGVDFGAARPASTPAVRKQHKDIHRKSQPMAECVTLRGYASGAASQKKNSCKMGMPLRLRSGQAREERPALHQAILLAMLLLRWCVGWHLVGRPRRHVRNIRSFRD